MKNPMKLLCTVAAIATIFVTGCSKSTSGTPVDQPAIEYVDPQLRGEILKKSNIPFSGYYPLTGIGTYNEVNQRAFAVMVNNHPKARPQSGLHKADIVYEILAEGAVTRFLAVFQSELPEVVGPVRSARDYYIYLSKGLGAIYVNYGGSPEAFDLLQYREITDYIGGIVRKGYADDQFFYRANFRSAPHNVYTTVEKLIEGAEKRNFSLTKEIKPFSFLSVEEMKTVSGEEASEVAVTYSNSYKTSFIYDENSAKYQRFVNGKEYNDRETKTPITVDNILIIEAPHRVVDSAGRRDIDLDGSGKGYLIQLGIRHEVEWKNVNGRIIPYMDGKEAGLVPGKTWVNVIPTSPGLEKMVSFDF
ncbi:DUF3048 domain-containing protein [Schinkia azotoformans]|uniref:DUF3048 domain-containing protein n=1 Tax=Schinkia azotoformans TaxID=1454 RepID=UPI002DBB2F30|nr:DUF3048 domain-containing protein [Schinkia azotoformans]MEC1720013.1 DUF3048 domain-containing protein [Schinkia azotoformans]MED4415655.1 DUF3048 domain-containing protein [Schinkia azotoformans]